MTTPNYRHPANRCRGCGISDPHGLKDYGYETRLCAGCRDQLRADRWIFAVAFAVSVVLILSIAWGARFLWLGGGPP